MKKISLRGLSEVLSDRELKNVLGGSDGADGSPKIEACEGKSLYDSCSWTYQGNTYYGCCVPPTMWGSIYCRAGAC